MLEYISTTIITLKVPPFLDIDIFCEILHKHRSGKITKKVIFLN